MPVIERPHYDPDARRWMVQVDQFVARPATEREIHEHCLRRWRSAIAEACEYLGDDVAEAIFDAR